MFGRISEGPRSTAGSLPKVGGGALNKHMLYTDRSMYGLIERNLYINVYLYVYIYIYTLFNKYIDIHI